MALLEEMKAGLVLLKCLKRAHTDLSSLTDQTLETLDYI